MKSKVKAYVLFFKQKLTHNDSLLELVNYKYFINKKDLANFLNSTDITFVPLGIKYLDVTNSYMVDKYYNIVKERNK